MLGRRLGVRVLVVGTLIYQFQLVLVVLIKLGLILKLRAVMIGNEGRALGHVETREDQLLRDLVDVLHSEQI